MAWQTTPPYPTDQGHLTGPNMLSTGKMVKGKVTRGRHQIQGSGGVLCTQASSCRPWENYG